MVEAKLHIKYAHRTPCILNGILLLYHFGCRKMCIAECWCFGLKLYFRTLWVFILYIFLFSVMKHKSIKKNNTCCCIKNIQYAKKNKRVIKIWMMVVWLAFYLINMYAGTLRQQVDNKHIFPLLTISCSINL